MAKNIRRILAMVLVMVMFASALPMQALAVETVHTTETSPENLTTDVYTTIDDEGNETIVVKITKGEYVDENGNVITVDREETIDKTGSEPVSSGNETKEWSETVQPGEEFTATGDIVLKADEYEKDADGNLVLDEAGNPIPVKDENGKIQFSGSTTGSTSSNTVGNTTITSTDERVVTGSATITGEDFSIDGENSAVECPVCPEDYEGKDYYDFSDDKCKADGNTYHHHYHNGLLPNTDKDSLTGVGDKPEEEGFDEGYDLTWTGKGDVTDGYSPVMATWDPEKYEHPYLEDEEGNIIYEYGQPVYDMSKLTFAPHSTNKPQHDPETNYTYSGMILQPGQFALKHENGEYFYAYCMDASTGANPTKNKWYNIRNLEDAIESEENPDGYITEEEAGMIRAIATNGYWGSESGQGSVESLKELLRSVYSETDTINVYYPVSSDPVTGNPKNENKPFNIYSLIDELTEAEALAVTQSAIWTFANKDDVYNGYAGSVWNIIGVLSASKYHNGTNPSPDGFLSCYKPEKDYESDARMRALYLALLNLDPIDAVDGSDTNVIPQENVITDVGLIIHDKTEGKAENADDNTDNDVYDADITFSLAFVPDAENDSLLVYLIEGYDEAGNPIIAKDADEKPIVRRLGKSAEDDAEKGIQSIAAENGVYTLTGLQLGENAEHTYDIRLEGTQYLENGVYIYQAHGGRKESQTLVGLANGTQTVTSTTSLSLTFEVDEKRNVVSTTVWTGDDEPEIPEEEPEEPEEEEDPPVIYRLDPDAEEEIPEEPVPLAAPVVTGDNSFLWGLVVMMAVLGMAVINLTSKKNKYEAF